MPLTPGPSRQRALEAPARRRTSPPRRAPSAQGQQPASRTDSSPGNYPGGISTSKAILYLSPGIYWLGGGGLHIQTDGKVISKAVGDDTGIMPSGGVLIYNTLIPIPPS